MNYSTVVKVARVHLVDRFTYTALPWAVLAFAFVVCLAIAASAGGGRNTQIPTGALAADLRVLPHRGRAEHSVTTVRVRPGGESAW